MIKMLGFLELILEVALISGGFTEPTIHCFRRHTVSEATEIECGEPHLKRDVKFRRGYLLSRRAGHRIQ